MIEFSSVCFSYGREILLDDVNFSVGAGEVVCLVGANGSGKTTIARLILGLLSPGSGTITVMGTSPAQARTQIGYVPQSFLFDPLFPITVREVVSQGRLGGLGGRLHRDDRRAIDQALELTGLQQYAQSLYSSLSGGQRQRTLIARALSHDWRVLIMDEPSANVDKETKQSITNILSNFSARQTAFLISHDTDFVSASVQRVLCVNKRVVEHSFIPASDAQMGKKIIHE